MKKNKDELASGPLFAVTPEGVKHVGKVVIENSCPGETVYEDSSCESASVGWTRKYGDNWDRIFNKSTPPEELN